MEQDRHLTKNSGTGDSKDEHVMRRSTTHSTKEHIQWSEFIDPLCPIEKFVTSSDLFSAGQGKICIEIKGKTFFLLTHVFYQYLFHVHYNG